MAGRSIDYTANLDAEDNLTKAAEEAADALDNLESKGDVEIKFRGDTAKVEADVQSVIDLVDRVGGEAGALVLTSNATQMTSEIGDLVLELNTLDANDPQIDIKVENIQALEAGLGTISDKAKSVVAETGSMSSAMGNAFGNAAQDLAGLAGITGTAGQAVGQLGDSFISAAAGTGGLKAALSGLGASLGPIAAISAAVWLVTSAVEAFNAPGEAAAALTKQMGEAMADTASDSVAFADVMRENSAALSDFIADSNDPFGSFGTAVDEIMSKIPGIGGLFKEAGVDIFASLTAAGESVHSFSTAVDKGGKSADDFKARLQAAKDAGKISGDQFNAVSEAFDNYSESAGAAAKASGAFAVGADEIAGILGEIAAQEDPFSVMTSNWDVLFKGLAEGTTNTQAFADALNALSAELDMPQTDVLKMAKDHMADLAKETEEAAKAAREMSQAYDEGAQSLADLATQSAAFGDAMDQVNQASELDFSQMAEDTVGSFDDMKESLTGLKDVAVDWSTVDLSPDSVEELKGLPDELAKVTDGISGMRDTIQTELQAAFDTGGIDAYREKAGFFAGEIKEQFPAAFRAAGASAEEANRLTNELLGDLQLLPENVQIQIQLTREQEARAALEGFSSFIDKLSEPKQVQIRTMIAEGDIEGALRTLNTELIERGYPPILLPVDADIAAANEKLLWWQTAADGTTGTSWFDANPEPAYGQVTGWKGTADVTAGMGLFGADSTPALSEIGLWKSTADTTTGTTTTDTDNKPALAGVKEVDSTAKKTKPIIDVAANIEAAIVTMYVINYIAKAMAPVINVGANTFPAIGAAAAATQLISSMRATIGVTAQLRSYPSAGEIAARIGVVRVPIDAYIRTMPRVNGAVP